MASATLDRTAIRPFTSPVTDAALDDLKLRLSLTRWPERETAGEWKQGVPLDVMRHVVDHWQTRYDWRHCEAKLDAWGQHVTEIDGLDIHFLHIRSPEPDALPLILTHGWPGSILEFMHVIGPLTDPVAHGGKAEDAFHLVVPSCPGFGFSGRPAEAGWDACRTAKAWAELMRRLGYEDYVAQGGDWGAAITAQMGADEAPGLKALHINLAMPIISAEDVAHADEDEKRYIKAREVSETWYRGYSVQQSTRPQTIGYSLTDSPVGQAAWIYEKFRDWTHDCGGDPLNVFALDDLLDNISLYWLTATAASSARIYWEIKRGYRFPAAVKVPTGYSQFLGDHRQTSRRWMERIFANITYWNEVPRGGHFAALQEPALFTQELRDCFRPYRPRS